MPLRGLLRLTAALTLTAVLGAIFVAVPQRAEALSGSEFNAGYIIADSQFYTRDALSQAQIQEFLNVRIGTCANTLCLNVLKVDTPTTTLSFGTCDTYIGEAGESAARIIYKVQQACTISAKVILATLQKEQGLVTSKAPTTAILRKAMGQGCPDTSQCDSEFYGFFIQVLSGARQLAWYGNPDGSHTSIKVGQQNAVRYSPNASCGSSNVLIENRATASLYYYTPYQPNTAALTNLGGTGDACSSYGNRNFWVYYSNWFGSPTGSVDPIGNIEAVTAMPGKFRVSGWAIDPNASESVDVHVYVGKVGSPFTAALERPDLSAAYPGLGTKHGFDVTVPVNSTGQNNVCVYAMNKGPGVNVLLGCRSAAALSGPPIGAVDSATAVTGGIRVSGWAIDPDTADPSTVHVYVDDVGKSVRAQLSRPDIGRLYPQYGSAHGFDETIAASPGSHSVCVYGMNTGLGSTTVLQCTTVVVPGTQPAITDSGRAPIGSVDLVSAGTNSVKLSGWALDPDTALPIAVHVYVDSVGVAFTANKDRPDIGAAFPGYGSAHGFAETVAATAGSHRVCVYGINTGAGGHTLIGCKNVVVAGAQPSIPERGRAPIGNVETVAVGSSGIAVGGWALDPDTALPIAVHVYVDSVGVAFTANKDRPDIGAAFPGYGSAHGFAETVAATAGSHRVCVYGINTGAGGHTLLRCQTVTV
ncbi:hypothetical protein [Cryobacterium lyxosi]|uniref:Hemagglutinin n=1 Tax=Cryobacterium lyxosi TaxID=1259228 RepID=A0A4R8ZK03_9MICO|nr:hypothetical protein [Cryobacterium lyxosi]TFD29215.1 hypothetical protein E3T27_00335 [Cryobacterium lyxosi]